MGRRALRRSTAAVLGGLFVLPVITGAADYTELGYSVETTETEGLRIVSATHDDFMQMAPGETVSWYLEVSSEHDDAVLDIELNSAGDMPATVAAAEHVDFQQCQVLVSAADFSAGGVQQVGRFAQQVNLRIDITADEDIDPRETFEMTAEVTGADRQLYAEVPVSPGEAPDDVDLEWIQDRGEECDPGSVNAADEVTADAADESSESVTEETAPGHTGSPVEPVDTTVGGDEDAPSDTAPAPADPAQAQEVASDQQGGDDTAVGPGDVSVPPGGEYRRPHAFDAGQSPAGAETEAQANSNRGGIVTTGVSVLGAGAMALLLLGTGVIMLARKELAKLN